MYYNDVCQKMIICEFIKSNHALTVKCLCQPLTPSCIKGILPPSTPFSPLLTCMHVHVRTHKRTMRHCEARALIGKSNYLGKHLNDQ